MVIHSVTGLRLLLTPMPYGSDGYSISRIGPINVPSGAHVVIRDQAVVSTVPAIQPVTKIRLEARSKPIATEDSLASSAEGEPDESRYPAQLDIPALAASFGPSIVYRPPEALPPGAKPFMLDGPPLPLRLPRFDILGCEPPSPSPAEGTEREPHLLLLHRGHCSFALKSHHAALAGAKGVIVISHPTPTDDEEGHNLGGFVVPGAEATEESDETMEALVPLVLVANSTGQALEGLVRRAEGLAVDGGLVDVVVQRTAEAQLVLEGETGASNSSVMVRLVAEPDPTEPEEEEEHVDGLILGGYLVRNIKLHRIRNASPPSP